jgi:hypothetical protein
VPQKASQLAHSDLSPRHVFKSAKQFPADCGWIAVRGGQIEGDQLIAVGETMLGPIGGPEFGVGRHMLRAEGCDMGLPSLFCGMADTLDVRPAAYAPFRGLSRRRAPLSNSFAI